MNANVFITKDYENETTLRLQKNKPKTNPIKAKGLGNELKSPIFPKLTKCPIYQRSYPVMRINIR